MKKPNVLLITSDQQHWYTLGVQNPEISTPNLDRLAQRGTLFTRAYCPNPTCTPTRASIITGQYPSQHGAWSLGTKLPEDSQTVGEIYRKNGYRTGLIGKAHFHPLLSSDDHESLESYPLLHDLDYWRKNTGPWYGFDHIELARNHTDEAHVGQHYAIWMEEKGLKNWRDYFQIDNKPPQEHTWTIPEEFHYNTWIAERSNAMLERCAENDEPFFLWSSFFDPHPSYLVPEPWDKMYDPDKITVPQGQAGEHEKNPPHFQLTQQNPPPDRSVYEAYNESGYATHGMHSHLQDRASLAKDVAIYYGMVSCMDKYIGQILDKLDDLGLADNTLIVFTSDHGHYYGHHDLIAKGPFHYEDGIRVPFIASLPGTIPEGRRSDDLVSLVDLAPTFLSQCQIDAPPTMSGIDQTKVFAGQEKPSRDHVIVEMRHQPTAMHLKTYINQRYKLSVYFNQDYGEMFDLEEDPGEFNNLWDSLEHQALKQELLLKFLHAEMGKEPLWMPRIAHA
ncbi:MAG: sulfatase-like hydrolase/transferase [Verrucomicrobiota bacterium]